MRSWGPLVTVCLSTLMLLVDITIVSVAIPHMTSELHATLSELNWTVDLYVLVLSAALMGFGSLADIVGRRRVYLAGLVVFALASLTCGLAPDSGVLIAARGVQGLGAAAMLATNIAILATSYTGRRRGVAFGIWGAVNGLSAAIGPILGGLLTQAFGWRAIFFVNLPVAVIALLVAALLLPESRGEPGTRVDVPGILAFTAVAALLVYGLIRAGDDGWSDGGTIAAFVAAAVLFVGFLLVERSRAQPMLDLRLARTPAFAGLMLAALVLSGTAFANLVDVSIWAQSQLDLDPVAAGLVLTPLGAAAFLVSGVLGRFVGALAPRWPIGIGLLLVGAGLLLDLRLDAASDWVVLLPGLIVSGVGVGLCSPVLASAAGAVASPRHAGMAGAAVNTLRQFGFALGIPVMSSLLTAAATPALTRAGVFPSPSDAADAVAGGYAGTVIDTLAPGHRAVATAAARHAFAAGLDQVFLVSGIVALAAGLIVLVVLRTARPAPRRPVRTADATEPATR